MDLTRIADMVSISLHPNISPQRLTSGGADLASQTRVVPWQHRRLGRQAHERDGGGALVRNQPRSEG
jgi:hypothetical protein